MSRRLVLLVVAILSLGVFAGCGGKGAASGSQGTAAADTDPLVLLPGSAIFMASLDVHAMYANASVGAALGPFTDSLKPESGPSGTSTAWSSAATRATRPTSPWCSAAGSTSTSSPL